MHQKEDLTLYNYYLHNYDQKGFLIEIYDYFFKYSDYYTSVMYA